MITILFIILAVLLAASIGTAIYFAVKSNKAKNVISHYDTLARELRNAWVENRRVPDEVYKSLYTTRKVFSSEMQELSGIMNMAISIRIDERKHYGKRYSLIDRNAEYYNYYEPYKIGNEVYVIDHEELSAHVGTVTKLSEKDGSLIITIEIPDGDDIVTINFDRDEIMIDYERKANE